MDSNPVIETIELRKTYGQGEGQVEALRGVDMRVDGGKFVAIVGPSGCGKSSLLSLLGGVDLPTSGRVLVDGVDLATLSDDQRTIARRERIGFIFQSFNLLPTLSAEENVALPLQLDGQKEAESFQRAHEALDQVGMQARYGHLPSEMSGGEQQRVAIARALAIDPVLLLADEPTGNLDSANSERTVELLKELVQQTGRTIVVVTHDLAIAKQADRVITLRDGKIVDDTSAADRANAEETLADASPHGATP